jgi:hypothetical protein
VRTFVAVAMLVLVVATSSITAPALTASEPVRCFPIFDFFPQAVTRLRGDVDGDRRPDTVTTEADWVDGQTCRAWLVVETRRGVFRREIDALLEVLVAPAGLAALVELDRRPGLEVAVVTWLGASTGFADVYGFRGRGPGRLNAETFSYAGSIVNRSGVDCVRRRGTLVVASDAEFRLEDDRYHVVRRFYALRAGVLRLLPTLTERARVGFARLSRFPEFAESVPFPSCAIVLGAS